MRENIDVSYAFLSRNAEGRYMGVKWQGDKSLPWTFIPFLMLTAVFIGEVMPVVIGIIGGVFDTYGAKEPIIKTLPDFELILIIYTILGIFFWLLFRYLNWRVVVVFIIILDYILERFVYWQVEGSINLVTAPSIGTFIGFVIAAIIVLILPYAIFQAIRKKWGEKGIRNAIVILFLLNVLGLGFTYYHMVNIGWFERYQYIGTEK